MFANFTARYWQAIGNLCKRNHKGTGWEVIHSTSFTELALLHFHQRTRGKCLLAPQVTSVTSQFRNFSLCVFLFCVPMVMEEKVIVQPGNWIYLFILSDFSIQSKLILTEPVFKYCQKCTGCCILHCHTSDTEQPRFYKDNFVPLAHLSNFFPY